LAGVYHKANSCVPVALSAAYYVMDSVDVLVWRGVLEYQRGNRALAQLNFRQGFHLHVPNQITGLERIYPRLARFFDSEYRAVLVFPARDIDVPARWRVPAVFVY